MDSNRWPVLYLAALPLSYLIMKLVAGTLTSIRRAAGVFLRSPRRKRALHALGKQGNAVLVAECRLERRLSAYETERKTYLPSRYGIGTGIRTPISGFGDQRSTGLSYADKVLYAHHNLPEI